MTESIMADAAAEAQRIISIAAQKDIVLRLIGGAAIQILCPTFHEGPLQRKCHDVDLVGLSKQSREIRQLIEGIGYQSDRRFNQLHGHQRLLFFDAAHGRDLDIFMDRLMQCHDLDFRKRLEVSKPTLPPADLLLSKLQVMHINIKDIRDAICLLQDCPLDNHDNGTINLDYISKALGSDWGFWRTVTLNLDRVAAHIHEDLDDATYSTALASLETLRRTLGDCPKSLSWKLRSIVGERVIWYEVPEEVSQLL